MSFENNNTISEMMEFLNLYTPSISIENGIFSGKYMDFTLIKKSLAQAKSIEVRNLVQDVIKLKKLEEASEDGLQTLVDAICEVMQELRKTEKWTPDWDTVLIHLACCKMDAVSRREWNSSYGTSPTFVKLLQFLENSIALKSNTGIISEECMDFSLIKKSLAQTKSFQVQKLVLNVINLNKLHETSGDGLQILVEAICEVMQELRKTEKWTPDWDAVLIHLAYCKMDAVSRRQWNLSSGGSPTFVKLLQFLENSISLNTNIPSTPSEYEIFSEDYIDFSLVKKSLAQAKSCQVQNLVLNVINLQKLEEASEDGLQTLVDALCEVMLELRKTEKWTSDWDTVLIHLACCKMDAVTTREWNSYSGKSANFAKLLLFLEK